jgi:transposase-like protein
MTGYSAEQKYQIVMELLTGNVSQAEICRRHGVHPVHLRKWREQFLQGGKIALSHAGKMDTRDEEIEDLKRIIGDQSPVIDAFKKHYRGGKDDGY